MLGAAARVNDQRPALDRLARGDSRIAVVAIVVLALLCVAGVDPEDADDLRRRARVDADLARDRRHRPRRAPWRADRLQVALPVCDRTVLVDPLDEHRLHGDQVRGHDPDGARCGPDVPARAHARVEAHRVRRRAAALCTTAFFYSAFLIPEVARMSLVRLLRVDHDSRARTRRPLVDRRGRRADCGRAARARRARHRPGRCRSPPSRSSGCAGRPGSVRCAGDGASSARSSRRSLAVAAFFVLQPAIRPALAGVGDRDATSGAAACGRSGWRSTSALALGLGLLPFDRRPRLAVASGAARAIPPGVRSPRSPAPRLLMTWTLHRRQGGVPLDRLRDARRGAQHDLRPAAADRRHGGLAVPRRRLLPRRSRRWAFATWLVLHYGYQLDFPYFEAPGYGIAAMANRAFRWDQPTIRTRWR